MRWGLLAMRGAIGAAVLALQLGALPAVAAGGLPAAAQTPRALEVTARSATGVGLDWKGSATGGRYQVRLATDPGLTRNARTVTTGATRLTLNSLESGTTYYFAVRARSGHGGAGSSAYTEPVTARTRAAGPRITVMSFNVLSAALHMEDHPWLRRVDAIADTVVSHRVDVLGAQEAFGTTEYRGAGGVPQWESLRRVLARSGYDRALTGSDGKLGDDCADGEDCWEDEYEQHGAHIYYNTATVRPIGNGGRIDVDNDWCEWDDRAAVWQIFRSRDASATPFLVVNTHLDFEGITERGDYERCRTGQVKKILARLADTVNGANLPVVLLGDLNSYANQAPVRTLLRNGYIDTATAGAQRTNAAFSSFHGFRSPLAKNADKRIDYIMATGEIGVRRWSLVARLDDSKRRLVGTIPSDHHAILAELVLPGRVGPPRWMWYRLY